MARQLVLAVRTAMKGPSLRIVGKASGVDHTSVAAIINGTTWPDLHTIARLEAGLGVDLWSAGVARLARQYTIYAWSPIPFPQMAPRLAQLTSRPRRFPGRGGTPRVSPAENGRVAAAHAP